MTERQPWEQDPSEWKEGISKSFSSIPRENISKLPGSQSIQHLLNVNDVELPQILAEEKLQPHALVTFSRIEWKWHADKEAWLPEDKETVLARAHLYDITQHTTKAHIIGIGRYDQNIFRPYLEKAGELPLDNLVSREHGLIFLDSKEGKPQVFYHDIGTEKKGSTNGTLVNDKKILQNEILPWDQKDYLSMGESPRAIIVPRFRVRYNLAGEGHAPSSG